METIRALRAIGRETRTILLRLTALLTIPLFSMTWCLVLIFTGRELADTRWGDAWERWISDRLGLV